MAGNLAGFDPDFFRTVITSTMTMGLNTQTELQPTFYFPRTTTWPGGTILDAEGKPVDARVQAVVTQATPLAVPCAVEFVGDGTDNEELVKVFVELQRRRDRRRQSRLAAPPFRKGPAPA